MIGARRKKRGQRELEAEAEERAFRSVADRHEKKNRGSQLLLVLGLALTIVGASITAAGNAVGIALVVVGLLLTAATSAWALKHWNA